MSRRMVQSFQPFAFQSDFSSGAPEAQDGEVRIPVTAQELAALYAQARAEGAAEMAAHQSSGDAVRLSESTEKLNAALADLVELARHLEAHAADSSLTDEARRLINLAASRIIDGQGELFAKGAGPE